MTLGGRRSPWAATGGAWPFPPANPRGYHEQSAQQLSQLAAHLAVLRAPGPETSSSHCAGPATPAPPSTIH
eukprot:CAMPEP_0202911604 /NCGR_PEP_ID=MMETSP1392-20130828/55470_1 /ASSEMBLY_ACC=CAM_ASM_000868 /TAXON_ID=225041 /ORGANISM="Chlamydomonas chlamydogama, Strain SAG 11-48b" /LENGTH=70 /DNA_ID=CAMNT_0049602181 /DNA_START=31 /DNA_END=241 /DNA_ORIENTATION=-